MTKSKLITIALMALLCMSMVFAADSSVIGNLSVGGNLGVGTTTPNTLLDLESSDPQLRLFDTDGLAAFILKAEGSVGSITTDSSSDRNFYFDNDGTADLFVGFGTSTPATELELEDGTFTIDQNTDNIGINIDSEATTKPTIKAIGVLTGNENMVIFGNNGEHPYSDKAVLKAYQNHALSTASVAFFANSGTGSNVFLDQNGDGLALSIDSEATTTRAIDARIDTSNSAGLAFFKLGHASSTGAVLQTQNEGSGSSILIDSNGAGTGIEVSSILNRAAWFRNDADGANINYADFGRPHSFGTASNLFYRNLGSATTTSSVVAVEQTNSGDDQNSFNVLQDGIGAGIFMDANNGIGINIDSEATSYAAMQITSQADGAVSGLTINKEAGATGRGQTIVQVSGGAEGLYIQNSGSNNGAFIDQLGSGRPLYITKSADDFNRIEFRDTSQGTSTNYVGFAEGNNAYRRTFHAYRNLGSANTGQSVATIAQASASDDQASLSVTNLGSGFGIEVESAAVGIEISSTDSPLNKYREFTVGEAVVNGDVVYFKSDGKMWETDADAEATSIGLLGIATETCNADATCTIMLEGGYTTTGLTTGSLYYLSTTKAGYTTTAPSTVGQIVRPIGQALSTTELYINPDWAWAEN